MVGIHQRSAVLYDSSRGTIAAVAAHVDADRVPAVDRLPLLLARHGRSMSTRIRQALGVSGLSMRHGVTLMHLAQTGPTSQQALIEALSIDPSALVTILNDLERDGLVERRRDPADRRRHIVEITTTGAGTQTAVERAIAEVEREVFGDLDDEEIAQLQHLLARVRTRHDEATCAQD
jgi:DNA-binding MarR family transcriptional regulator